MGSATSGNNDRTNCKHCGNPFTARKAGQMFCNRACSNAGRDSRRSPALNRPCDCGSGLMAKRSTVPDSAGFRVSCPACKVAIKPRSIPIRPEGNDYDRAQARARRILEERRELAALGVAGG